MSENVKDRCSGDCCRNFSLAFSPDELMGLYRRWLVSKDSRPDSMEMNNSSNVFPESWDPDIHIIALMAVYLGPDQEAPKYVNDQDAGSDIHRYRCNHWDEKTGDCTIYEYRPAMCRRFPGPGGCNYAGCTWESKKRIPVDEEELVRASGILKGAAKGAGVRKEAGGVIDCTTPGGSYCKDFHRSRRPPADDDIKGPSGV